MIMVKRHSGGSTIVVMRHGGDVGLIWWVLDVCIGGASTIVMMSLGGVIDGLVAWWLLMGC